jgi:hypothetical protein
MGLYHTQLPLDIVQTTNLLGESSLESVGVRVELASMASQWGRGQSTVMKGQPWTHISELDLANFTQSADDLSSDLVGNIELGQAHVRRAEEGITLRHDGSGGCL